MSNWLNPNQEIRLTIAPILNTKMSPAEVAVIAAFIGHQREVVSFDEVKEAADDDSLTYSDIVLAGRRLRGLGLVEFDAMLEVPGAAIRKTGLKVLTWKRRDEVAGPLDPFGDELAGRGGE